MQEIRLYQEAREEKIIRPQKAKNGFQFDELITISSPVWQKRCCLQIRRYQSMECNDGFLMDLSNECWRYTEIFPIKEEYFDTRTEKFREWLVGAVCFSNNKNDVFLEFCWIHPFFRGKGLLKSLWPRILDRYPSFYVSYPRTKAMQGFLDSKSINYKDPEEI